MAIEQSFTRQEQLPPNYLGQFYSGVPGQNVPGIMPLMNQELVNRMMGFGVEGANPYTYSGERIADFAPAEREAMRMTGEGMGGYLPYLQQGEQYLGSAVGAGQRGIGEAQNVLRRAPGTAAATTYEGLRGLRGAGQIGRGALGRLGQAAGVGMGSMKGFDPSNISSFYDPYEEDVVQQTLTDVREGLAKGDINRRAQAIGAGAFGGSRSRLMGEELARAAGRGATEAIGGIRSRGYEGARGAAQQGFEAQQGRQAQQAGLLGSLGAQQSDISGRLGQLGTATAGLGQNLAGVYGNVAGGLGALGGGLSNIYGSAARDISGMGSMASGLMGTDIARMQSMGALQRGMDQRGLDLGYQNFVGQYNQPLQTIGQIGGMAAGYAPALGGTTIQQTSASNPTNPLMQAAGTALAAYGAFKPYGGYGAAPAGAPIA